jgi:hypothetical protein
MRGGLIGAAVCTALLLTISLATAAAEPATLRVHIAAANNQSPYTFVRAKFEPGELSDPWAVRFFDDAGTEVPYFVWDSITWQVAREGREDWAHQYPLTNHYPGKDPEIAAARQRKVAWAKEQLPALGAKLAARDEAAAKHGTSVCAVLYLLRYHVAPLGKEKLTLKIYLDRQIETSSNRWTHESTKRSIAAQQGELKFGGLPGGLQLTWKGRDLFHYAGYDAGQSTSEHAHLDPSKPWAAEITAGLITKLTVTGQTAGRNGDGMDWQCAYWLVPGGAYVALEGFALEKTDGYIGGNQKISSWKAGDDFTEQHAPLWESPWWLHRSGDQAFVATHLFHSTPLTIGYGNNPFTANSMAPPTRAASMELENGKLALRWFHSLDDLAISRLFAPELFSRLGRATTRPEDGLNWLSGNRQAILTGKVENPPEWMSPELQRFVEKQLKLIRWEPQKDWFYRQYAVGVGERAEEAEGALRQVLSAAAGWIDRPFNEEQLASLLVETARRLSPGAAIKWSREMESLPALLNPDPAGLKQALARWPNEGEVTDKYLELLQTNLEMGGDPIQGHTSQEGGRRGEGWIVNPSYHATQLPYYVRFLEHFELPYPEKDYRQAIVRFADYTLDLLGGKPLDYERLRKSYVSHWPSRFIAVVPLMLAANDIQRDERYMRAATIMFDVLMEMVERNPQGYWSPWAAVPEKWEPFDTVYNGAGTERGLPAFWSDGRLDLIGRERASKFVAAQARYLVFSGQLLDTLEADNVTSIYATKHGGHPAERKTMPLFLYDDFEFYRGLFGDLIEWSAAIPSTPGAKASAADRELGLAESGCYLLRWALGIGSEGRGGGKTAHSRWFEHRLERLPGEPGFRLRVWNRLPWAESTLSFSTRDAGLSAPQGKKGPIHGPLIWLRFAEPAYREPLLIEASATADDHVAVKITRPVVLRLHYGALAPKLNNTSRVAILMRNAAGDFTPLPDTTAITHSDGLVEWSATPGEYEIRPDNR